MNNQINLESIADVKELKAMKSDNYDIIEHAKNQIQLSTQNINALNVRIEQIEKEKADYKETMKQIEKVEDGVDGPVEEEAK